MLERKVKLNAMNKTRHTTTRMASAWPVLVTALATLSFVPAAPALELKNLRCEYRSDPLGIDAEKPRLSWIITDSKSEISNFRSEMPRGQTQTAYRVLVASSQDLLEKDQGDLWDSGQVGSDQSIQVEYAGKPLQSQMACHWKVRVWDKDGKASHWSTPALWSMGLLKTEDWQAKWIKAGGETSPWLRKEFILAAAPEQATAFVNVKGYYELYVNGKKVSDDVLMPAVSVYKKRSLYNTYDIGKYLRPGRNCVGVWLGLGLVFRGDTAPLARVQLDLSVGGKREVIGTNTTWTWTPSTHTEFRWGWCGNGREHIDMRRDIPDWSKPGCAGGKWLPVAEVADPSITTSAQSCPPNRIIKTLPMVYCRELRQNVWELDFGTNLTGWMKLRLPKLEAGRQVTIRFADKRLASAKEEVTPVRKYELAPGTWKIETPSGPIAYTVYSQKDFPSWGYMLAQGATTMWEQWDGYWSQIHSCYTCPGGWVYQGLAGIRPDEAGPGFKRIIIKPAVVGDLTWVKCHYDSIHGRIVSNWQREGGKLTMEVAIPANTTATVYVPAGSTAAKAGLHNGELIIACNGRAVQTVDDLRTLQDQAAGRKLTLAVIDREIPLKIELSDYAYVVMESQATADLKAVPLAPASAVLPAKTLPSRNCR